MGLFDIFKKKPAERKTSEKCSECFRPIEGHVWSLENKKFCKECYNRRMAIVSQTTGQSPEEYDFEMTIEDVFFIKNHGVVVTGKIHRGVIHRNDTVAINGATYTVTLIDVIPNQVEYAKEGANVGLHLSTMNAALFKQGDVVTAKRFESTPKKNTFICDICKKELPIKYRNSDNVCVECKEVGRQNKNVPITNSKAEDDLKIEYLDDITFIREIKHKTTGPWHQYDVLLAACSYGWDMMKEWADYMATVDLENISQVATATLGLAETDITASFVANGSMIQGMPELDVEKGMFSIAGISKTLKTPMKIVWINQTNVLRFFTLFDDSLLMSKYVETVVRRTFGTPNSMKLGKPIPKEKQEAFRMIIKDVFFLKGRGVVLDGTVQAGQIFVNEYISVNGKSFLVRGIKTEKGLADSVSVGAKESALLLGEKESADFFKSGDIVTKKCNENTVAASEISNFKKLQNKCKMLSNTAPDSDELKKMKAELWDQLINLDAIWVAVDPDLPGDLPYIGLTGPMEIFTEEAYGMAAKEYFSKHNEGDFKLKKIEKENIVAWFERALFLGATVFNLDNGVQVLSFTIEDYMKYDAANDISRENRAIRCGLFRSIQAKNRYEKIKHRDDNFVKTLISVLYSNGYTALVNGTVFALTFGPCAENVTFVSKNAFEKRRECFVKGDDLPKYKVEIDTDSKIPAILKDELIGVVAQEAVVVVEKINGLETIRFPNDSRFVPIFTDKAEAEKMRQKFASFGKGHECNVIAVNFDEIISPLLVCDGAIVDHDLYSHIISKETLLQIKAQMEQSNSAK